MGGAPRSGTTVLRKLFDRHPAICCGPETKVFVPAAFNLAWLATSYDIPRSELEAMRAAATSQGAFIDAFAARVRAGAGKPRWAEKTPQNIRNLDWILTRFPQASVVHIIRDGRDVVCSMRQHPDWRWVDGSWQKVLVPRSLEWYARRWLGDTAAGMAWRRRSALRGGALRGPRGGPGRCAAGDLRRHRRRAGGGVAGAGEPDGRGCDRRWIGQCRRPPRLRGCRQQRLGWALAGRPQRRRTARGRAAVWAAFARAGLRRVSGRA